MSLLIRNGQFFDSSNDEGSDVFVVGDTISGIGNFPSKSADTVIDAQGLTIAPGFIDIHAESDHYLSLWNFPDQTDLLGQGITTALFGHSGISIAPWSVRSQDLFEQWVGERPQANIRWGSTEEMFSAMSRTHFGVNPMTLVGMSSIVSFFPKGRRNDSAWEAGILSILETSIDAGAAGISHTIKKVPSDNLPVKTLFEAARLTRAKGKIFVLGSVPGALKETFELGKKIVEETGATLLLADFSPEPAEREEYLRYLEELELIDYPIYAELSPFEARPMPLYAFLPQWAWRETVRKTSYGLEDSWLSSKIRKDLPVFDPKELWLIGGKHGEPFLGHSLLEIQEAKNLPDAGDALLTLMRETKLNGTILYTHTDSGILEKALSHPRILVGSRGVSLTPETGRSAAAAPHYTRSFSAYLDFCAARNTMPLKERLEKISAVPAMLMGLKKRGALKEGNAADIVLMKGHEIEAVIISGKLVWQGGYKGTRAGKFLKGNGTHI